MLSGCFSQAFEVFDDSPANPVGAGIELIPQGAHYHGASEVQFVQQGDVLQSYAAPCHDVAVDEVLFGGLSQSLLAESGGAWRGVWG